MKYRDSISNVSSIHDCYGCGVCSSACPQNIISMVLNKNGFYEPNITEYNKCINCGICLEVCAFNHSECALTYRTIKSWAAWSNDKDIRQKCSSGGIGFEIGKQLIEQGYHAVGCRYDIKCQRTEHYIATSVEEFVQSIGSKYIQSYTEQAFKQILRKGQKYLITGTPCQIDSFRRMIQKFHCDNNFILMDFFCHSVPSMWLWNTYIKMLQPKIGRVTYASWRNKFKFGWHDSYLMGIDGDRKSKYVKDWGNHESLFKERETFIQSRMTQGDLFYKLFLGDFCSGLHCEKNCKYKYNNSSADIRIGDLWGKEYQNNDKGVSALIAFTDKGRKVINSLYGVTLIEHSFDVVAEGQMKENIKMSKRNKTIMWILRRKFVLYPCMWNIIFRINAFPYKVIHKVKKIL